MSKCASLFILISLLFAFDVNAQGTSTARLGDESTSHSRIEHLPWYLNLGMSTWAMGYGQGQNYSATTGQFGYRVNHTLATEVEASFGRASLRDESGENETVRQKIFTGALVLTPIIVPAFGFDFLEVAIVPGGSYFETIHYWAGFAAARMSVALDPRFAIIAQYRKYVGMSDVVGSRVGAYSANPQDFTTVAASLRF